MNDLIKRLTDSVSDAEKDGEDMDDVSWGMQWGVLISYNEAKFIIESVGGNGTHDFGYWQKRCLLAEKCLEQSAFDPEENQHVEKAYDEYEKFKEQNTQSKSIKALYEQWCKETKRKGNILIGGSINEFFEWLETNPTQE